jgi:hypothetical protein
MLPQHVPPGDLARRLSPCRKRTANISAPERNQFSPWGRRVMHDGGHVLSYLELMEDFLILSWSIYANSFPTVFLFASCFCFFEAVVVWDEKHRTLISPLLGAGTRIATHLLRTGSITCEGHSQKLQHCETGRHVWDARVLCHRAHLASIVADENETARWSILFHGTPERRLGISWHLVHLVQHYHFEQASCRCWRCMALCYFLDNLLRNLAIPAYVRINSGETRCGVWRQVRFRAKRTLEPPGCALSAYHDDDGKGSPKAYTHRHHAINCGCSHCSTNLPVLSNIRRIQLDVVITSDESELHRLLTGKNEKKKVVRMRREQLQWKAESKQREVTQRVFEAVAPKRKTGLTVDLNLKGRTSTFIFSTPGPYTCKKSFFRQASAWESRTCCDRTSKDCEQGRSPLWATP